MKNNFALEECPHCEHLIPFDSMYCNCCFQKLVMPNKRTRSNGEGTVYKERGKFTAEVTVGWQGKKRVKRKKHGFLKKTEAIAYLPILASKPEKKAPTLSSLYQPWEESYLAKKSKSKQGAYKIAYKKLEAIAYTPINELTIEDLQGVINKKAPTYYPARDMKTLLSHLYKRACAQGNVTSNLATFIELPVLEEESPGPFNENELKTLWKAYSDGDGFIGYILLMIYTGMMPGELFKCKKAMINWKEQTITGCGIKTKKRKETPIIVADYIVPVLETLCGLSQSKADKLLCMNEDKFYEEYKAALARHGCTYRKPYSCRHTTATALALGEDISSAVIQEIMRHSKFTTTLRYIHPQKKDALAALNKLKIPAQ